MAVSKKMQKKIDELNKQGEQSGTPETRARLKKHLETLKGHSITPIGLPSGISFIKKPVDEKWKQIRESKEYKELNPYMAAGYAESIKETKNEEQVDEKVIAAWQLLIDTGQAWMLGSWFHRQANSLIEQGFVGPPEEK